VHGDQLALGFGFNVHQRLPPGTGPAHPDVGPIADHPIQFLAHLVRLLGIENLGDAQVPVLAIKGDLIRGQSSSHGGGSA